MQTKGSNSNQSEQVNVDSGTTKSVEPKATKKRPFFVWCIYIFSCFMLSAAVFEAMALLGFIELPQVVEVKNDNTPILYLLMTLVGGVLFYAAGYLLYRLNAVSLWLFTANLGWYLMSLLYSLSIQTTDDSNPVSYKFVMGLCLFYLALIGYSFYLKRKGVLTSGMKAKKT